MHFICGNVKQNIRMYNEEITDEEVKEAAQFVQANTFMKNYQSSMKRK